MGMCQAEGSIGKGPGTGGSEAQYQRGAVPARNQYSWSPEVRARGESSVFDFYSGSKDSLVNLGMLCILKAPSGFCMKDGLKRGPEWQRGGWTGKQTTVICVCFNNPFLV